MEDQIKRLFIVDTAKQCYDPLLPLLLRTCNDSGTEAETDKYVGLFLFFPIDCRMCINIDCPVGLCGTVCTYTEIGREVEADK